ncbi:hypothetical protein CLOM_g21494, partial [Closterium sp. NIES-68]
LAFNASFTFFLIPQSGTVGSNGFAFVILAKAKVGKPDGVGYAGVGTRSIAIEFDTLRNDKHGDMEKQHVGLNINGMDKSLDAKESPFTLTDSRAYTAWVEYEPGKPGTLQVFLADSTVKPVLPLLKKELALCDVLQAGVQQQAFFFGFMASTTVKPFQKHVILNSAVQTGIPLPPKPVKIIGARGLSLSVATFAPSGANPFSRYVGAGYSWLPSNEDSWLIHDKFTWDGVPFLEWPVKDQDNCTACWAYAVVASVEAAYGIATQERAPQLSVEPLFAAMGLSDTDKCTAGGSPTEAFEKLITLDGSSGLTGDNDPASSFPVYAFESTRFKGYVGLMLAVQRQPVVVHIEASAATFVEYDGTYKYQDGDCYTGNLNHVVLVVGYCMRGDDGSQNRIAPPFWIIRNSWGKFWGDKGHMRMDIQGGDGVCGINVLPGIYPIVKIPGDPCGRLSYQVHQEKEPSMNPCGWFSCHPTAEGSNRCNCTTPEATTQPFVEAGNGVGSNTCAYVDVCGSYFKNPCYVGTCINDGRGSYSCVCPPNYIESKTAYDPPTCDPVNTTATTMTVSGENWWCSDVYTIVGLSMDSFILQNMDIDCNQPLPKESVLQLDGTPPTPCTAFFYTLNRDTCASICKQLNFSQGSLTALNPGLDCTMPIKAGHSVCVERNATFAYTVPECVDHGVLTPQDTCERLLQRTTRAELYRNNPGLTCSPNIPPSATAVGSNIGVEVCLKAEYWPFKLGMCKKGRVKPVSPSMACSAAYRYYGGATSTAVDVFNDYNSKSCSGKIGSKYICVP